MAAATGGRIMIDLGLIDHLTGGRLGVRDIACPECGPTKRSARSQRREVLRIWRLEDGFASFHCARCGEKGAAFDRCSSPPDPVKLAAARRDAAARDQKLRTERLDKAQWLWSQRRPIAGSIAETYLRQARGYVGPLPATLGFLPARGEHPPAMIAAFGLAHEVEAREHIRRWEAERDKPLSTPSPNDPRPWEPGPWLPDSSLRIADADVVGVHLTKLRPDGSDRLRDDKAKITIGKGFVAPIVLAPPNDLMALTIGEGIEKVLADHEVSGAGAWAAASAVRLPGLADLVPGFIECVTVLVDDNEIGKTKSAELAAALDARGFEVRLTPTGEPS
jgi:hypothetical protein